MKKSEKILVVEDLTARLGDAKSIVLTDITGLRVNDQNRLRRMLNEVDAKLLVVKNTLLSRALGQAHHIKHLTSNLKPVLSGQTAIIISQANEVEPLQALGKFIKKLEMPRLKVGIISGNIYDETSLVQISKLPGREVLAAQVVGALTNPLYNLVGTLQGNLQKLVYLLSEVSKSANQNVSAPVASETETQTS